MSGIVHSHWAVLDEIVVEDELEVLLRWTPNHSIQLAGTVSAFYLASVKTIFVSSYGNNKRVASNVVANLVKGRGRVMIIETGSEFRKLHYGPVEMMNGDAGLDGSVHRDSETFAHLSE